VADLALCIGRLTIAVDAPPEMMRLLARRYAGFFSEGEASWRLDVVIEPHPRPIESELRAERQGDVVRITRSDVAGTIDLGARRAQASLWRADEIPMDAFLRVLYSLALTEHDGLLVHAASIVRDGRAYLFPGRSGAGKTTLARLATDAILLSDEVSLVRAGHAHGTPFWGELATGGAPVAAPLAAIYFPTHATVHHARRLASGEALRRLLACVLFFVRDEDLVRRVFTVAGRLVADTPCFELSFRPDADVWSVVGA
jgi:hypothetical protein